MTAPLQGAGVSGAENKTANTNSGSTERPIQMNDRNRNLPSKNGFWEDTENPGNCTFIIDDNAQITWHQGQVKHSCTGRELKRKYHTKGVNYRKMEPDFTPFVDSRIGSEELIPCPVGRDAIHKEATKRASVRLGCKPEEVKAEMARRGLVWHECQDGKTVQAIPIEINAVFRHTGAVGFQNAYARIREKYARLHGSARRKLIRTSISDVVVGKRVKSPIHFTLFQ